MKKIMIVNTSHEIFSGYDVKTGLWLSELVHFYDEFNPKYYRIDIFNIKGGRTPLDPMSLKPFVFDTLTKKYYKDKNFMKILNNSQSIDEANAETYDCIYFTGGHGVMYDFTNNEVIHDAITTIYNNGGIVGAVCHGISALLNVKTKENEYFINQKAITGFSNLEEILANRKKYVPFMLETELKNKGAEYTKAILPLKSHVVIDTRLVTGQNPNSAKNVAKSIKDLWQN